MPRKAGLTEKQRIFAEAYVSCGSKVDAYKTAYNTKNMAQNTCLCKASLVSRIPHVAAYIAELQEAAKERAIANREEILMILTEQARGSISKLIDDAGGVDIQAIKRAGSVVKSIQVTRNNLGELVTHKVQIHDPRAAAMDIAKLEGYAKQTEISAENITLHLNMGPGVQK